MVGFFAFRRRFPGTRLNAASSLQWRISCTAICIRDIIVVTYCPSAKVEHEVLALLATVIVASLDWLWLVWSRSQLGGIVQHGAMTINAVLILVAATLVLRHPLTRRMQPHRRSALRLLMLASGAWFFRVGLMFWIAVNGGPVGFDPATLHGNKAGIGMATIAMRLPNL